MAGAADPLRAAIVSTKEVAPRELSITRRSAETHVQSKCCPGCRITLHGGTRQAYAVERSWNLDER